MKPRTVITLMLLAVVLASVVVLIAKETIGPADVSEGRLGQDGIVSQVEDAAESVEPLGVRAEESSEVPGTVDHQPAPESASEQAQAAERTFVVYYFHRTRRCRTCLGIEASSRKAVQSGFASELASGRLQFKSINVETPGNEHYLKGFELSSNGLAVAEFKGGRQVRRRNLSGIWEHIGRQDALISYVQGEVTAFMGPQ